VWREQAEPAATGTHELGAATCGVDEASAVGTARGVGARWAARCVGWVSGNLHARRRDPVSANLIADEATVHLKTARPITRQPYTRQPYIVDAPQSQTSNTLFCTPGNRTHMIERAIFHEEYDHVIDLVLPRRWARERAHLRESPLRVRGGEQVQLALERGKLFSAERAAVPAAAADAATTAAIAAAAGIRGSSSNGDGSARQE
jgi:hypothetical protein